MVLDHVRPSSRPRRSMRRAEAVLSDVKPRNTQKAQTLSDGTKRDALIQSRREHLAAADITGMGGEARREQDAAIAEAPNSAPRNLVHSISTTA